MINIFVRVLIIYILVLIVMRLMGKRELGQMQPFELVIAIMIADLASVPMADTGIPITNGIIPILALLLVQLVISIINLKSMDVLVFYLGFAPKTFRRDGGTENKREDKRGITLAPPTRARVMSKELPNFV